MLPQVRDCEPLVGVDSQTAEPLRSETRHRNRHATRRRNRLGEGFEARSTRRKRVVRHIPYPPVLQCERTADAALASKLAKTHQRRSEPKLFR